MTRRSTSREHWKTASKAEGNWEEPRADRVANSCLSLAGAVLFSPCWASGLLLHLDTDQCVAFLSLSCALPRPKGIFWRFLAHSFKKLLTSIAQKQSRTLLNFNTFVVLPFPLSFQEMLWESLPRQYRNQNQNCRESIWSGCDSSDEFPLCRCQGQTTLPLIFCDELRKNGKQYLLADLFTGRGFSCEELKKQSSYTYWTTNMAVLKMYSHPRVPPDQMFWAIGILGLPAECTFFMECWEWLCVKEVWETYCLN